ncbi:hypothetical protein B0H19DRAFT_1153787 [Mycena capillaripes]|nr:hypothetical protein B0H19DRAFT_1153787 [Mycena capillaripes]
MRNPQLPHHPRILSSKYPPGRPSYTSFRALPRSNGPPSYPRSLESRRSAVSPSWPGIQVVGVRKYVSTSWRVFWSNALAWIS